MIRAHYKKVETPSLPSALLKCVGISFLLLFPVACQTPLHIHDGLEQDPPRELARSLKLPAKAQTGFVIAGLHQGAVPQGLTLLPGGDHVLTSHYFDNGLPSCIVSTDWNSGKITEKLDLFEPDGSRHKGHVGGIASDPASLWIASDDFLYRADLKSITHPPVSGTLLMQEKFRTEASHEVAFCGVFNGLVWAGEFAYKNRYRTATSHHLAARDGTRRRGWVCGYDPVKGFGRPERVLSIPDRTQGIYASADYIFLSISYGRRNRSSLEIFRNPLREQPHKRVETESGSDVPLWFLDGENHVRSIDLPPMSENITVRDGRLLVLFESGAEKFRFFGKKPIDQLIILKLDELNP